jgi:hypothetical protein
MLRPGYVQRARNRASPSSFGSYWYLMEAFAWVAGVRIISYAALRVQSCYRFLPIDPIIAAWSSLLFARRDLCSIFWVGKVELLEHCFELLKLV